MKPSIQSEERPVVLLHGFDRFLSLIRNNIRVSSVLLLLFYLFLVHHILLFSSCLEWRYTYPLLEEAGLETWAVDILGWGFSDLGLSNCFIPHLIDRIPIISISNFRSCM